MSCSAGQNKDHLRLALTRRWSSFESRETRSSAILLVVRDKVVGHELSRAMRNDVASHVIGLSLHALAHLIEARRGD
eukprot:scaffold261289_cov28-Tisochrysis_lutea.AAC.2